MLSLGLHGMIISAVFSANVGLGESERSAVNMNYNGPSTHPWGTPVLIGNSDANLNAGMHVRTQLLV